MKKKDISILNSIPHNAKNTNKANHSYTQLMSEAEAYMSFLENHQNLANLISGDKNLNPEQMYISQRNQEREENNKTILQYLLIFLKVVYYKKIIEKDVDNPFEQFRNFVLFDVQLLREVDVIKAVIRYGQKNNTLKINWNEYYWRLSISRIYNQCLEMIKGKINNSIMDCCNCFIVLMDLCQFWFDIHYKNNCSIRQNDILTYKISKAILKKLKQEKSVN
ncbi:MAG: hypothetical protein KAS65_06685 [Candidatus Aminicenantes bacterium]|nr:hypothetical protein [Candidatus Aminicenantes bacterium]